MRAIVKITIKTGIAGVEFVLTAKNACGDLSSAIESPIFWFDDDDLRESIVREIFFRFVNDDWHGWISFCLFLSLLLCIRLRPAAQI